MAGNTQAIEQSFIATFSEGLGGGALVANAHLQQTYGTPAGLFSGVYFLSQMVAQSCMEVILQRLNTTEGTGYLTKQEFFETANDAWRRFGVGGTNIEHLFPGNFLTGTYDGLAKLSASVPQMSFLDGVRWLLSIRKSSADLSANRRRASKISRRRRSTFARSRVRWHEYR